MKKEYHHASHSKYLLHYHFVFCCKYRKKLLKYALETEIKQLFLDIADFEIDVIETDIDHIHVLVDAPPTLSPFDIVNRLKSHFFQIWKVDCYILN